MTTKVQLSLSDTDRKSLTKKILLSRCIHMLQILGLVLFIFIHIYSSYFRLYFGEITNHLYFFMVVFACLVGSTCLLLACLFSLSTSSIIAKTLYVSTVYFETSWFNSSFYKIGKIMFLGVSTFN